jgi:hypothetical protein
LAIAAGDARAAACGDFPKVSWWGNMTHAGVASYVDKWHKGNWTPYVQKWEAQLEKLRDIHGRGSAVVVSSDKIRLEGDGLKLYIDQVQERVDVTKCLAEQAHARNGNSSMNRR